MRLTGIDGEDCLVPPGRALRLAAVLYAADERTGCSGLRQKVARLHDQKGNLEVTWKACPTFGEMLALDRAWTEVGSEAGSEHRLADGWPLAGHDGRRWVFDERAIGWMIDAEMGDVAVAAEFLLDSTPV